MKINTIQKFIIFDNNYEINIKTYRIILIDEMFLDTSDPINDLFSAIRWQFEKNQILTSKELTNYQPRSMLCVLFV